MYTYTTQRCATLWHMHPLTDMHFEIDTKHHRLPQFRSPTPDRHTCCDHLLNRRAFLYPLMLATQDQKDADSIPFSSGTHP